MCWRSAANLDWLFSFYCFEVTDGQSTHQSKLDNTDPDSLFAEAKAL